VTLHIQQVGRFLTQLMEQRLLQLRQQQLMDGQQSQPFARPVRLNQAEQVTDFKLHPELRLELQGRSHHLRLLSPEPVMVIKHFSIQVEPEFSTCFITRPLVRAASSIAM
jgi:hypothetical protein